MEFFIEIRLIRFFFAPMRWIGAEQRNQIITLYRVTITQNNRIVSIATPSVLLQTLR